MMEIRHLETFLKIIEMGSYTAAAIELGYTQSTITSHVQILEQEVGGELFSYTRRKMQLSYLGNTLVPLAEDLLATKDKIKSIQAQENFQGVLRVAAPESLTISRLSPILQAFTNAYPQVQIILSNGTCKENQEELVRGRVDVALLLYPAFEIERCIHKVLTKEDIVIIGNKEMPDHFDSIRTSSSNYVYITNEKGCCYRTMFEKCMENHEIDSFQTMELWSIGAIKQMVMSGMGFAALPYITVKEEISAGKLKIIDHKESFETIYFHVLIKQKKWTSPIALAFKEMVVQSVFSSETKPS